MHAGKEILEKHAPELRRIGAELFKGLLAYQIETGAFDARGKSDEEIFQFVANTLRANRGFRWSIDHTAELLGSARLALKKNKHELACLFYALWLEHYLNRLVRTVAIRHEFSEKQAEILIRETNLRSKLLWLHLVMRKAPPPKSYVDQLGAISDRRNQFVHYKWRFEDVDAPDDEGYEKSLKDVEKIVRHLQRFESNYIYNRQKHRLRILTVKRSLERTTSETQISKRPDGG